MTHMKGNVYFHKPVEEILENAIYKGLKHGWGVGESERHDQEMP